MESEITVRGPFLKNTHRLSLLSRASVRGGLCDEETPFSLLLLRCFHLREVGRALHLSLPAHGTHARRRVSEGEGVSVVRSSERG